MKLIRQYNNEIIIRLNHILNKLSQAHERCKCNSGIVKSHTVDALDNVCTAIADLRDDITERNIDTGT